MSNSLPRTFDKNPWKFASRHGGGRNAYSKEKKERERMRKPNLQKQSIPDLFSKINGNILVTIALKSQDLTLQC